MQFLAGTGHHDLVEFGHWEGERPRGWVDVPLIGQGEMGGDGVRAMVVVVRVLENHQNGKDTHVRGVQVFGRDEKVARGREEDGEEVMVGDRDMGGGEKKGRGKGKGVFDLKGIGGADEPDWMKDPVIR